jgi:hypothetical protein
MLTKHQNCYLFCDFCSFHLNEKHRSCVEKVSGRIFGQRKIRDLYVVSMLNSES